MNAALSTLLSAPARHSFLSGSITYLTGREIPFAGDQAMAFSCSEGSSGQLLGGAFSASCVLTLNNADGAFTTGLAPYGAQVRVNLCAGDESEPLAVFTVTKVSSRQGDPRLILYGSDALGTAFEGAFTDDFSYPLSLGALAGRIASQAAFSLPLDFPNADVAIASRPDWGDISLRQALAYTACAAGCFAMITRAGALCFKPAWQDQFSFTLPAEMTLKRDSGETVFGPLTALSIALKGAKQGDAPLIVQSTEEAPGTVNCLSISGNPLFAKGASHIQTLAQGVLDALSGMRLTREKITWRGDPALTLGDSVRILGADGTAKTTLITRQTLSFSRGFSMQSDCAVQMPQSAVGRIFTSSGALNAALLEGSMNGAIIRDGSVAASSLVSGSITALQLAAQAVTAEKLSAGAVTTDKLAASAVTADKLDAGAVTAGKLSAGAVEARHLSAGVFSAMDAHLQSANIDWASISQLQSAVAQLVSAEIESGDIDWARIKDLVTNQAIITQGQAGQLFIARLAVTEANLVSLSVGQLMVKGQDGCFYSISVNGQGQIVTEKKLIGNPDVADESIDGGQKLIEGSVTAATLNVRDIFGDSAVIRQLIAANLDVDTLFSREATLNRLNALDITGNESIRVYVARQEALNVYLRVTENGLEIGKVGDPARFRADNRTLEVTNIKTERLGITQAMSQQEEWAWIAAGSGMGLKYIG